mgnify:CR=1 FL=1
MDDFLARAGLHQFRLGVAQVEGGAKRGADERRGRTECNRVVNFKAPERLIGQMVDVSITQAMHYSLRGEVLAPA